MEGTYVETTGAHQEFTNISLGPEKPKKHKKAPKRILHFSDGTLEEYSSSEDEEEVTVKQPEIDPKTLTWVPWMWFYVTNAAKGTLSVADACGEKLAWFFGITTPKYQSAIDEYYRLKEEEEREKAEAQAHSLSSMTTMEEVVTTEVRATTTQDVELEKY